jgi:hypothetical protein
VRRSLDLERRRRSVLPPTAERHEAAFARCCRRERSSARQFVVRRFVVRRFERRARERWCIATVLAFGDALSGFVQWL